MIEIPLSEIRGDDVGCRVLVTRDGNAFDGMLVNADITRADYEFKDRPRITARLKVKTDSTELVLTQLPLDYLIQVDRPAANPITATPEKN